MFLLHLRLSAPEVYRQILFIAFPPYPQFPTVAIVGEEFSFTLSPDTFYSNSNITILTANGSERLRLQTATCTLSGRPAKQDSGDAQFLITATNREGRYLQTSRWWCSTRTRCGQIRLSSNSVSATLAILCFLDPPLIPAGLLSRLGS